MRIAREDLSLDRLYVLHPGEKSYPLDDGAEVLALHDMPGTLRRFAAS